jgi:hypothetical protein
MLVDFPLQLARRCRKLAMLNRTGWVRELVRKGEPAGKEWLPILAQ